jgi:signal transduction histidine kinase
MGVRTKLAAAFVLLLGAAIFAVSIIEIDHVTYVMIDDLGDSGAMMIDQAFEQLKPVLARNAGDPLAAARADGDLRAFLSSSQAFGRGVVYVRITDLSGATVAGAPPDSKFPPAPFADLFRLTTVGALIKRLAAVWNPGTYEISRSVVLNGRPVAIIKVGLSTGLIADEMRRSIMAIGLIAGVALLACVAGAMLLGGFMMRPVQMLASSVELLAEGSPDVNFRLDTHDELGSLAEKFDRLSRRIRSDRTDWENERGQFFNIFRSITDGVILLDARGVVLFANNEAHGRLGLPAGGSANGKPLRMLIGRDHPLARTIETAYAVGSEVHDLALDLGEGGEGAARGRLLVSIFSLGRGPEPPGLLVIIRDLKPVQELENVVNYSGQLARLGGLISGVAHQIRNPLNAMSLQLELLAHDGGKGRPLEERINGLRREINRLDQAVNGLLRFMRPGRLKYEAVSLNALAMEIAGQITRPSIKVEYQLDPNVPEINADAALLREAIRNLVANAIEAMPDGGALALRTRTDSDGHAEMVIADSGPGIPAEDLERIFQLYYTTKDGGTGLGLPMAARAVDLHGGTVRIESQPGAGAAVIVRLPIVPVAAAQAPAEVGEHHAE